MGIVVRKNFVRLRDIKLVTRDDMTQVGALVINKITARTQTGIDAAGRPFRVYSPKYWRAKREALGSGGSRVNLSVSGEMLNAMTVESVTDASVTVGFGKGD